MKKRAMTLLEIMIVIFLITLISGVVAYNLKGSMDKGRAFKTKQGIAQLRDLLHLCLSDPGNSHITFEQVAADPKRYIKRADLARDPDSLVVDGWGVKYKIELTPSGDDFVITSESLKKYEAK